MNINIKTVSDIRTETVTLKTRYYGFIIDKTTEYNDFGRTGKWYEIIDSSDPDNPIEIAFRNLKQAVAWCKENRWRR